MSIALEHVIQYRVANQMKILSTDYMCTLKLDIEGSQWFLVNSGVCQGCTIDSYISFPTTNWTTEQR
ncbi:hypothetical protein CHS0354_002809, partial [Potamilus streckersoni]